MIFSFNNGFGCPVPFGKEYFYCYLISNIFKLALLFFFNISIIYKYTEVQNICRFYYKER